MHYPRLTKLIAISLAAVAVLASPESAEANSPCDSFKAFPTAVNLERRTSNCKEDCRAKAAKEFGCRLAPSSLPRRKSLARYGQKDLFSDSEGFNDDAAEQSKLAKIDNYAIGKFLAGKSRGIGARARQMAEKREYQERNGRPPLRDFEPRGSTYSSKNGSVTASPEKSPGASSATADHSSTPAARPESPSSPGYDSAGPSTVSGSSHPELLPRLPDDPIKGFIPDLAKVAKAEADRRLALRAQRAIERNEPFPMAEAQKAHDPEIRRDLESVAIAQQSRQEVKEDEVRFTKQIETFEGLAQAVIKNKQGLDTLREASGGQVPPLDAEKKDPAAKLGAQPDASGNATEAKLDQDTLSNVKLEDLSPGELKKLAQEAEAEESAASASGDDPRASSRIQRRAGLRERLRAMLRAQEASVLSDTFEGKIARESSNDGSDQENPLLDVISSAFQTANEVTFAMRPSETDAEVNRLVREGQRDIASLSADGVLATDSPALFQRVTLAHRRCEEHRCVRTDRN